MTLSNRGAIVLAVFVAVAITAAASHAEQPCPTEERAIEVPFPGGSFYIVNDACQPECLFSLWIYQESNGQPGLQRCNEFGDCPEGCQGDTIIF